MKHVTDHLEACLEAKKNVLRGALLELPRIEKLIKETQEAISDYEMALGLLKK